MCPHGFRNGKNGKQGIRMKSVQIITNNHRLKILYYFFAGGSRHNNLINDLWRLAFILVLQRVGPLFKLKLIFYHEWRRRARRVKYRHKGQTHGEISINSRPRDFFSSNTCNRTNTAFLFRRSRLGMLTWLRQYLAFPQNYQKSNLQMNSVFPYV